MPLVSTLHIPRVTHIGHLDREAGVLAPSRDGPALAVSTCPEIWRQITRSNAPDIVLFNPTALFVDAFSFTPRCMDEIQSWAVINGYIAPCPAVSACWVDPQTNAFHDALFETGDAARATAGPGADIQEIEGHTLSRRALKRLGRAWHNPLDWYGACLLLYTREIIVPKRPLVCGIWWSEALDIPSGIAPGGQLLPDAFSTFNLLDEDEEEGPPLSRAFPGLLSLPSPPPLQALTSA